LAFSPYHKGRGSLPLFYRCISYYIHSISPRSSYRDERYQKLWRNYNKKDNFKRFLELSRVIDKKEFRQLNWILEKEECIIDFIGKYENLQEDFNKFLKVINEKYIIIPKKNISKDRKPIQEYYDKESMEMVREICKDDIDYFGYKFPCSTRE